MCKNIKKNKKISLIFTFILLLANFIISIPKITAPPPPLFSDQFIGEIIPNRTLSLNLINSNVLVIINSTNYPDKISINFDANYTFFNPENNSNIRLILPFSLGIEVIKSNFSVKLNKTEIDFNLYNFTEGTVNTTEIDLDFIPIFHITNPITLIQANLTTLEIESYTIRYEFSGLINDPLNSWSGISIFYYLNTSKTWNGNTTGSVEFRVLGKLPIFSTIGNYYGEAQISDIYGGKSAIWDWNNRKIYMLTIGIKYDESYYPPFRFWDNYMITINIVLSALMISSIIGIIVVRRKARRRI
ncbi:MAG: hypothetical protein ACFE8M_02210 [Candidatus Hermodarchaeota archaeon]